MKPGRQCGIGSGMCGWSLDGLLLEDASQVTKTDSCATRNLPLGYTQSPGHSSVTNHPL